MKFKEWYKEYCNYYSPDKELFDDEDVEPTLRLFFYNLYRNIKASSPIYKTRIFLQKTFRKNHLADNDLWEADTTMAEKILPVLYAFQKLERHGYPGVYSEYEEHSQWKSKEDYDKQIEEGKLVGGGMEAWERDLDYIIRAIEGVAFKSDKKITKWYIDNFGMDPYANDARNEYKYYTFECDNGNHGMTFGEPPEEDEKHKNIQEHTSHGNYELLRYADEFVANGLKLFAERWQSIWD
jgi:hypothetical protein